MNAQISPNSPWDTICILSGLPQETSKETESSLVAIKFSGTRLNGGVPGADESVEGKAPFKRMKQCHWQQHGWA